MTLQYFNCSINGFLFANDQHIINVNYDDTNLFFIVFLQHAWVSFIELKPSSMHLVCNFHPKLSCCLINPYIAFCKINSLLCPHLGLSLHHTLLGSSYINLMLQISIQKGIVNVYYFPLQFFNKHS